MSRILAIDFGSKRVGLAISDPSGIIAQPFGFIQFSSQTKFAADLKKIIEEKSVKIVIFGLPKNMDGTLGSEAKRVEQLSKLIQTECSVEIKLQDERLTTSEAEKMLVNEFDLSRKKRRAVRDAVAACLILQSYLDSQSSQTP